MSPDLRSVYSCIPDNATNFIVIAMYLSIALYEKILQLQLKSIFTRYAVMSDEQNFIENVTATFSATLPRP